MKYIATWIYEPANAEAIIERFKQTGGQPPEGVTMEARWFDVAGGRGFAVSESDDPIAIAKWCRAWSDLMTFEVIPVIDDAQMVQVLQE
jgi:diaminopimelate decarboxylase